MSLPSSNILGLENSVKVKIIDTTLPLDKRMLKENIVEGKSIRWTADYLGIGKTTIYRYLNNKQRVYSPTLNKEVALRICEN